MLRRLRGRVAGPQHLGDPVHGHQPGPLDREQLQQGAGFAAAQAAIGEPDTIADHAESARKMQLHLRGNTSSTEQVRAHALFVLAIIGPGKPWLRPLTPGTSGAEGVHGGIHAVVRP